VPSPPGEPLRLERRHDQSKGRSMEKLIIIGAGGHGRDVLDTARASGWAIEGFIDDAPGVHGTRIDDVPVLGGISWLLEHHDGISAVIAIGNPRAKERLDSVLSRSGASMSRPIVHPTAWVSPRAELEEGVVVFAGSSLQPGVRVARHAYVYTVSTIGHDTTIGRFACLHPGVQVGGEVSVGEGCFIGIGATILPRVRIGAWTTVGAGAVVIDDLPANVTAVGVPAKVLKDPTKVMEA
jgi:sugar O-acyltransferase (sialic acid O-acetyltransferase NeuD family)